MRTSSFVAAFAGSALYAFAASAVPIGVAEVTLIDSSVQNALNDADVYAAGFRANTPTGATWSPNDPTITPPPNSISGIYKSPFQNATITAGGDNGPTYFSVGGSIAGGEGSTSPALLTLGTERTVFNILWGSIDEYNRLSFFDASNNLIQAITGTDLINAFVDLQGGSAPNFERVALLSIALPTSFKSIEFFSEVDGVDRAAFEFALAPVPLPAAAWLMIAALASLGFVARKRQAV